jgi:hypothetical protein
MNVLDNQVELLFLDHDHLPARTLRVEMARSLVVKSAVYGFLNARASPQRP